MTWILDQHMAFADYLLCRPRQSTPSLTAKTRPQSTIGSQERHIDKPLTMKSTRLEVRHYRDAGGQVLLHLWLMPRKKRIRVSSVSRLWLRRNSSLHCWGLPCPARGMCASASGLSSRASCIICGKGINREVTLQQIKAYARRYLRLYLHSLHSAWMLIDALREGADAGRAEDARFLALP